ncbi:MAG: NUDIX domain-containing protein [Candidatus Spechtbacterales bacterium]
MAVGKEFPGVNPDIIRPLTDEEETRRGWKVELTVGQGSADITPLTSGLRLYNEKMGIELRYGMRAEGFDGMLFHEPSGGGSVMIPYVIHAGELYIGLVEEERKNMGGRVLCAPGGFIDPGETPFETATREFEEETGATADKNKVIDLNEYYEPANSNRAIVDTSREGEGAHFYAIEFTREQVFGARDPEFDVPIFLFKNGSIKPAKGHKGAEKIFGCRFYPWHIAATRSDMFANAMFSRLAAHLMLTGKLTLSFE